jgi:PIN domain nuclease of toxin-antitoxin system
MKYLIDTNIFIFLMSEDFGELSPKQKFVVFNQDNELYLSEASLYEMSIKKRNGNKDFNNINLDTLEDDRKKNGIRLLKSTVEHYFNIVNVPIVYKSKNKLHADPFDLLIISTAIKENMPILSTDRFFPDYEGLKVVP